jgi:tetratricopeptide (TPR) repeat protein
MLRRTLCILCLCAISLPAAKKQLVAPNSPEDVALGDASREGDLAKRVANLDAFVQQNPAVAAAAQIHYLKTYVEMKSWDKALEAGQKAYQADSGDPEVCTVLMQAATGKGDNAAAAEWGAKAGEQLGKDLAARPAGMDDDEWKKLQTNLTAQREYIEYNTFIAAQGVKDAAARAAAYERVGSAFTGPYAKAALVQAAVSYQQAGNAAKLVPAAEAALKADPENETMHLLLGEVQLGDKQLAPALQHARSVVKVFESKAKPENLSDADWAAYQKNYRGAAQSIIGRALMQQDNTEGAVPELKSAADNLAGNPQALAPVLYNLAYAYAKVKRTADARATVQKCLAIPSPFQKLCQDLQAKMRAPAPGK